MFLAKKSKILKRKLYAKANVATQKDTVSVMPEPKKEEKALPKKTSPKKKKVEEVKEEVIAVVEENNEE